MYATLRWAIAVVGVICAMAAPVVAAELNENLAMFSNLADTEWEGHFEDAEESMTLYMKWEPLIGGASVEMSGWSTGSDMTRRNIHYWDPEKKKVAYLALTSNGYVASGTVEFEGSVMTFLGRQTWPDGTVVDTKGEWEFLSSGKIRATGFKYQNGEWIPGHRILFTRTDPK